MNTTTDPIVRDPFLRAHPGVSREAALAVLDRACRAVTGQSTQGDD